MHHVANAPKHWSDCSMACSDDSHASMQATGDHTSALSSSTQPFPTGHLTSDLVRKLRALIEQRCKTTTVINVAACTCSAQRCSSAPVVVIEELRGRRDRDAVPGLPPCVRSVCPRLRLVMQRDRGRGCTRAVVLTFCMDDVQTLQQY